MTIANLPEKKSRSSFSSTPLKVAVLSSPLPLFTIWLDAQPPLLYRPCRNGEGEEGAHYAVIISKMRKKKGKSSCCKVHVKRFIFKYKFVCCSLQLYKNWAPLQLPFRGFEKMEKLCRRVICSSHHWTASLKRYFSARFSHVSIIESRVGSCEGVMANRVETSHITSLLNSMWIGSWFSLTLFIPLYGNILLPGNPFYKWMKLEKTNLKLIEL